MLQPQMTLRVLLVSDREELRDSFAAILREYAGDHQLYWVAQPDLAHRRALEVLPHVVLLDDTYGAQMVTRTIRQILAGSNGAAVLAVVDENALGMARQAVMAGARGFIVKPLAADETWSAIHQLVNAPTPGTRDTEKSGSGAVLAFVAPKGGTGRTTTAVNTALALVREGNKVAILDADFAAPALDVVLNLRDDRDITHLLARAAQLDRELIEGFLATHSSGLRVLLAPPPGQLNHISLPQIQQIVGQMRKMFDWVVVDLGLPLDDTAFAFLDSADRIIMTVMPEMVGLRNTRLMIDQLHSHGHGDEKIWLILNRSTIASGIPRKEIENRLRVRVHDEVPDDQPLVSLSVNRGVPLMLSDERSAVARAIKRIAHALHQEQLAKARPQAPVAVSVPVGNGHPVAARSGGSALSRWLRRPGVEPEES
ncbi:MAG: AAA family ATPase [Caldilineaceae bacterium]